MTHDHIHMTDDADRTEVTTSVTIVGNPDILHESAEQIGGRETSILSS